MLDLVGLKNLLRLNNLNLDLSQGKANIEKQNIETAVGTAIFLINNDRSGNYQQPSVDWFLKWMDGVKSISDKDFQLLWSVILQKESKEPGSVSFHTLEAIKTMDKEIAQLFEKFCSMCVKFTGGTGKSIMLPLFGRGSGDKDLSPYGLTMRDTYLLGESGLIHTTKIIFTSGADSESWSFPLEFQRKKWGLKPEKYSEKQEIEIRGLELTESGKELFEIVSKTTDTNFENFVKDEFLSQGVRMVEAVD